VQPVHDREVLPEQHSHKLGSVEHRQFEHGNERDVAARLEQEAAQFKDKRIQGATTQTQAVNPTVQGEHVHHHVHETIQPVVQKETIQPSVVHTTVPIHEVHHNAAQHHSTSALPPVSMQDFKKQGGILGGREERNDGFEGEPRAIGGPLGSHNEHGSHHEHSHHKGVGLDSRENTTGVGHGTHGTTGAGLGHGSHDTTSREGEFGREGVLGREISSHGLGQSGTTGRETGSHGLGHSGTTGREGGVGRTGDALGQNTMVAHEGQTAGTPRLNTVGGGHVGEETGHNANTATGKKPSLMDKLNPKIDANGDGKAGFMK